MARDINSLQAELATVVQTAAPGTTVYPYRCFLAKPNQYITVQYFSGRYSSTGTLAGTGSSWTYIISTFAKHDNTPATMEAAEQFLNTVEAAIFEALDTRKSTLYIDKSVPFNSIRPAAPIDAPFWRIAEIYLTFQQK